MPALMDHVADVEKNGGVELHRLAMLYTFPDFVKTADHELNLMAPKGQPVTVYADPVRKQFPCHTKAATWLSYLFYQEKHAEFHPKDRREIEKRFDGYIKHFGIKTACDAIQHRWSELHKTAEEQLPDSAYALVQVYENGTKDRHLPLRSTMEIKAAAEYIQKYHDRFTFPQRNMMATRILEKAAAKGANLKEHQEYLEKQAGRGVCDPAEVVEAIEKRAMSIPADTGVTCDEKGNRVGGLRAEFKKLAACVRDTPRYALQPDMLIKLATTLDQLDRQLGLVKNYGKSLARPEDIIFKATFSKVASDMSQQVTTTTGKVYEKAALQKIALADLRDLFGDEFVERVRNPLGSVDPEKMAEEVAALPRPDAQLLDGLFSENGIIPLMHKAASAKQGLDSDAMAAIANSYIRG